MCLKMEHLNRLVDQLANSDVKTVDLGNLKAIWIECIKVPHTLIRKAELCLKKHGIMDGRFYPIICSLNGTVLSMPRFCSKLNFDSVTLDSAMLRNNFISFTNERAGELWKSSTVVESGSVLPGRTFIFKD